MVKDKLCDLIIKRCLKIGDFVLRSGQKSTYYIDIKLGSLSGAGAHLIGEAFFSLIQNAQQEAIPIKGLGGLTLGADPLLTATSLAAYGRGVEWPVLIVRKDSKGHGTATAKPKYVEGIENLKKGDPVGVLEDVTTTGGSSLEAYQKIKDEGFNPTAIFSVVDREQGAEQMMREKKIPFFSIFKISEILRKAQARSS